MSDPSPPRALPLRVSDWPAEWLYNVRERVAIMQEDPSRTPEEHRARAVEVTRTEYRRRLEDA